jgi:hypothetical protein
VHRYDNLFRHFGYGTRPTEIESEEAALNTFRPQTGLRQPDEQELEDIAHHAAADVAMSIMAKFATFRGRAASPRGAHRFTIRDGYPEVDQTSLA